MNVRYAYGTAELRFYYTGYYGEGKRKKMTKRILVFALVPYGTRGRNPLVEER